MNAPQKKCNSRWDRNPVLGVRGKAAIAKITERDVEIFKLLTRYRYLRTDDIHAFVGGHIKDIGRRLRLLSRKPNVFLIKPDQQRASADSNYRPLVYEIDERGSRELRERGFPIPVQEQPQQLFP